MDALTTTPQPSDVGGTLDRQKLQELFQRTVSDFNRQQQAVNENRKIRRNQVNVKQLREAKLLQPDETYVAVRVIDENIMRDMPTYLAYVKQSTRMAIFRRADGAIDTRLAALEDWFTGLLQYSDPAWEQDYIKWIDGSLCHGKDFVEVVYDITKPGHVAINHVGIDRLVYDLSYDDIQQSPLVARGYRLGPIELMRYRDAGLFNAAATDALLAQIRNTRSGTLADEYVLPTAYKVYTKVNGEVYFFWYSSTINEFLTEPRPFFNGIHRLRTETVLSDITFVPEQQTTVETVTEQVYPFVPLSRKITEDNNQFAVAGHAHDSYYLQEAATAMVSSLVNGSINASKTMWAPDDSTGLEGSSTKQINFEIHRNAIWSRPMKSFSPPYPDPMLINALQYLQTQNGVATNQTAFAVSNRKDSRKTATELSMAQQQTSQVNSVQVLHLSIAIRAVAMRAWAIVRSEVQVNNIVLPPQIARDLFDAEYILSSAGDVDYVQRMELISNMQQDWPILSQTAVGPMLLQDYIKARYPESAARYVAALEQQKAQQDQTAKDTALIQGMAAVLQELATDEHGQPTPEAAASGDALRALQQQIQARLAQPAGMGGMAAQPGNGGGAQPIA